MIHRLKALLLGLERQVKGRVPLDHPVMAWLVQQSAYVRNARLVGPDGRTAHKRARGTPGTTSFLAFGETCSYKARSKEQGIGASTWRWGAGVWLGVERRTGQYIVFCDLTGDPGTLDETQIDLHILSNFLCKGCG